MGVPTFRSGEVVAERTSCLYSATLQDAAGAAIPLASVSAITLTLRDVESDTLVNGRDAQDVLKANGGTLHNTSGAFTMLFDPDDTAAVGSERRQKRIATFGVVYTAGELWHELEFTVKNLADAP
jgi:hypothetical protein